MKKITTDLLFFSHYRWDFTFQRPHHLSSQFAKHRRVFFIEEPIFGISKIPLTLTKETDENVQIVVPYLPDNLSPFEQKASLQELIDKFLDDENITTFTALYNTPKALGYTRHLEPAAIIYDCIDDYSSHILGEVEKELLNRADLVFTNSHSLYVQKQVCHANVHYIPSSVDYRHFYSARLEMGDNFDLEEKSGPKIGFSGVIDDRIDINLIEEMARLRPHWEFVLLGPVVSLPESLPSLNNIRFIGQKNYNRLPDHYAAWDCSFTPYKVNEHTACIEPEETLQFLAAGQPVVSTPLHDMIATYDKCKFVSFATSPEEFITQIEESMAKKKESDWHNTIDGFLEDKSWETIIKRISELEKDIYKDKGHSQNSWPKFNSGNSVVQPKDLLYSLLSSENA